MSAHPVLDRLRGGLVVSVQAPAGSPLDDPGAIAAMAAAAVAAGAAGLRVAGAAHLHAVRERLRVPVIGIVKRAYDGFEPYITPTLREAGEILKEGAEIVAFDATDRPRPDGATLDALIGAIHAGGALAMADCSCAADATAAAQAGADILATTLCGYTPQTKGALLPALGLVAHLRELKAFTICEGGIASPQDAQAAMAAGADAIVVGTAITGVESLTARFAAALRKSSQP